MSELGDIEWGVGLTVSPRKDSVLDQTLSSIRGGGWRTIAIFAEPGTLIPAFPDVVTVERPYFYGSWTNWICSWFELFTRYPKAGAYIIFEDDVVVCRNARRYLERSFPILGDFGSISIYTPEKHKKNVPPFTFHDESYFGQHVWGTQAIVFSRASLHRFLSNSEVLNHLNHGFGRKNRHRDMRLGAWAYEMGETLYYHTPSLADHAGTPSTLLSSPHQSGDFVGVNFDAATVETPTRVYAKPRPILLL